MNRAGLLLIVLLGAIIVFAACGTPAATLQARYILETEVGPRNSPGTISMAPAPDSDGTYTSGTVVELTASPSGLKNCHSGPYWAFVVWAGDAQGSQPTVNITMDGDKIVAAAFEEIFPPGCPPTCKGPTLEISVLDDTLQFDKERLEVAEGTEVALCFTNDSSVSNGNQHNWILVQAGKKDDVVQRGSQHPENGWVQPEDPDVIARTKLLFPEEKDQARFTAPQPGTYQFVCTFPGHNASGMSGVFVITP